MTTKDKFCIICYTMNKGKDGWYYWDRLLEEYKNNKDYILLKEKLDKIVYLLNSNESTIIDMDVENELWEYING